MEFIRDVVPFLNKHHRGVVATTRPNGSTHSSIVVCGAYKNKAAFVSVYPNSQKIINLRRNPRCTVLSVTESWREYVVVEGAAELFDYSNTESEKLRPMLRAVYMACSDSPHPDWEEYDKAMVTQKAVVVLVEPSKLYGLLRD